MAYPPPYTRRVLASAGVTSPQSYVVPAGYELSLVCVDIYNGGTLTGSSFYLEGSSLQTIWQHTFNSPNGEHAQWTGRQVFYGSEAVTFRADEATDVTATGYLLVAT